MRHSLLNLLLAALLLGGLDARAQAPPGAGPGAGGGRGGQMGQPDREGRRQKIEAARVAFLTERLNLTTEQAQKFWPVYNEFDAKRRVIRKRINGQRRDLATLADNQLQPAVDDLFAARQEELNLEKEYVGRFQKVISLRQTLVLVRAEREFAKFLLRKLEERRGGGRPPIIEGGPGPDGEDD